MACLTIEVFWEYHISGILFSFPERWGKNRRNPEYFFFWIITTPLFFRIPTRGRPGHGLFFWAALLISSKSGFLGVGHLYS